MNKNLKNSIGSIVGVIIGAVVIKVVMNYFNPPVTFDQQLMNAAEEINKTCPFMIDKDTRLDSAIGGPGKTFKYNYTIINYAVEELNVEQLKSELAPDIINNVKTSPEMETFRENEVTIVYNYNDKNGNHLLQLKVIPGDYK